jgi:predicted transcriptional regulator of viral defense system
MRNDNISPKKVLSLTATLPFFRLEDLIPLGEETSYLKIVLSRLSKKGEMIRLKKSMYVAKSYVDALEKKGQISQYVEWLANALSPSSYLSLESVLYEQHLLTEVPKGITSCSLLKTFRFSNRFGNFFYHRIQEGLFEGFHIQKKGNLTVLKATRAKGLFDFLYLRKNVLDKGSIGALRLNLEHLRAKDWRELEHYIKIEGSGKMKLIYETLKTL